MNLSDGEKLTLVMLAEIYKAQKIKGDIDPDLVLTSIFNDKAWGLKLKYSGIFNAPGGTPPVVKETCDILDMYRMISSSFDRLSGPEKKRVETEAGASKNYIRYQGFDGNNDDHLGIVIYLVNSLKKNILKLRIRT